MNDDTTRTNALRVIIVLGSMLVLAGAFWLATLIYQQFSSSTAVVQSERGFPLLPAEATDPRSSDEEAAQDRDPASSVPVDSAADATYAPSNPVPGLLLTPRLMIDSDLGTGSVEFSGVTLNEDTNRLLIADDAGRLFEFDLDDAGLPITPLRRTIRVAVGGGDIEGISWMSGETYVIAHEDDGRLTVVQIDEDITTITDEHLLRTVDTVVREENGNGLEGVAVVQSSAGRLEFVVVDERPPTVYGIGPAGDIAFSLEDALDVPDLSGIYVSPSGMYSVVSDEGRVVIDFVIDDAQIVTTVNTIDLEVRAGRFEQAEGLVRSRDGTRLYVVGEDPGPGQFSFGFWSSE